MVIDITKTKSTIITYIINVWRVSIVTLESLTLMLEASHPPRLSTGPSFCCHSRLQTCKSTSPQPGSLRTLYILLQRVLEFLNCVCHIISNTILADSELKNFGCLVSLIVAMSPFRFSGDISVFHFCHVIKESFLKANWDPCLRGFSICKLFYKSTVCVPKNSLE